MSGSDFTRAAARLSTFSRLSLARSHSLLLASPAQPFPVLTLRAMRPDPCDQQRGRRRNCWGAMVT
eukprot:78017-Rhodomonas_salina.10